MSGQDINDAVMAGLSLDEMLDAARAQPASTVKGQAARTALADDGVKRMSELVEAVGIAQGKAEAAGLIADLMEDSKAITAIATARTIQPSVVAAGLLRIRQRAASAATALDKAINARAAKLNDDLSTGDARNLAHLKEPRLVSPPGYAVEKSGVYLDEEVICPAPLIITGVAVDVLNGHEVLELTWWRRGRRKSQWLDRDVVMDGRKLLRAALDGAPVDSSSATAVVRYLHQFEAANIEKLPESKTTTHMGWCGDSFVLPERSWPKGIALRADAGLAQLASAVKKHGTWEGWCKVVGEYAVTRPLVMLGIYAAACTPLLQALGLRGFVADWSDESSKGKTTTLIAGASTWGDPDPDAGLVMSWSSSSDVGPTSAASFLQSLPLIMDDTKRGKPQMIARLLYDIPAGRGRLKGSKDGGIREQETWRTCLLSTGEAPITAFNSDGGAQARTLVFRGPPVGGESYDNKKAAQAMARGFSMHYGHLGPKMVEAIMREGRSSLLRRYDMLEELISEEVDGAIGGRLAGYVATLALAGQIMHDLGVPRPEPEHDPIRVAIQAAQEGGDESDRPREALLMLIGWASSNQAKFWGRHNVGRENEPLEPHGGFVGRWDRAPRPGRPHWLCIRPDVVRSVLSDTHFDVESVIGSWYRRGWVVPYTEPSTGKVRKEVRVRVNGQRIPVMALDSTTVEGML